MVTKRAMHVWCKKFAHGRESVVHEEEPGRLVVSTTDATIAAVDSLSHVVKQELEHYVEK